MTELNFPSDLRCIHITFGAIFIHLTLVFVGARICRRDLRKTVVGLIGVVTSTLLLLDVLYQINKNEVFCKCHYSYIISKIFINLI